MMGGNPINGATAMSAAANKKLVQQVYADAANRSGTTFIDNLADDACWIVTGQYSWSHQFKGRDAILNGLMGHFRSFFAERPCTVGYNFIADGDYVVVEARGDNVTKAGLRYDNQYCMVYRIENGKIKEIKEYCDSALVEQVLGPFPASRVAISA
jgi:ketosteroid isomerase-like protein